MVIDFLHYNLEFNEAKREVTMFIKVGGLQIETNENEMLLFHPQQANKILLDYDTGRIKNPNDCFAFFGKNKTIVLHKIKWLVDNVLGFHFEINQAYDKGLFYRAIKKEWA